MHTAIRLTLHQCIGRELAATPNPRLYPTIHFDDVFAPLFGLTAALGTQANPARAVQLIRPFLARMVRHGRWMVFRARRLLWARRVLRRAIRRYAQLRRLRFAAAIAKWQTSHDYKPSKAPYRSGGSRWEHAVAEEEEARRRIVAEVHRDYAHDLLRLCRTILDQKRDLLVEMKSDALQIITHWLDGTWEVNEMELLLGRYHVLAERWRLCEAWAPPCVMLWPMVCLTNWARLVAAFRQVVVVVEVAGESQAEEPAVVKSTAFHECRQMMKEICQDLGLPVPVINTSREPWGLSPPRWSGPVQATPERRGGPPSNSKPRLDADLTAHRERLTFARTRGLVHAADAGAAPPPDPGPPAPLPAPAPAPVLMSALPAPRKARAKTAVARPRKSVGDFLIAGRTPSYSMSPSSSSPSSPASEQSLAEPVSPLSFEDYPPSTRAEEPPSPHPEPLELRPTVSTRDLILALNDSLAGEALSDAKRPGPRSPLTNRLSPGASGFSRCPTSLEFLPGSYSRFGSLNIPRTSSAKFRTLRTIASFTDVAS